MPAFNTSLITRIGVSCRWVRPFQPWDGSQTHPGGVSPSSSRCVDRALWSVACKSSLSRCCSASYFCFGVAVCAARCLHIAVLHCASTSAPSFAPTATFTPPSASCSNSSAAGCAAPYSSPRRLMIGGPPRPPSRFTLGQGVAAVGWGAVAASTVAQLFLSFAGCATVCTRTVPVSAIDNVALRWRRRSYLPVFLACKSCVLLSFSSTLSDSLSLTSFSSMRSMRSQLYTSSLDSCSMPSTLLLRAAHAAAIDAACCHDRREVVPALPLGLAISLFTLPVSSPPIACKSCAHLPLLLFLGSRFSMPVLDAVSRSRQYGFYNFDNLDLRRATSNARR